MWLKKRQDKSYVGVAIAFILIGAGLLAFGLVSWLVNVGAQEVVVNAPASKAMSGLVIMALGYIQLELGLIREK